MLRTFHEVLLRPDERHRKCMILKSGLVCCFTHGALEDHVNSIASIHYESTVK